MQHNYYKNRISVLIYKTSMILILAGVVMIIPFFVGLIYKEDILHKLVEGFVLPGTTAVIIGVLGRIFSHGDSLTLKDSMFICVISWLIFTVIGAVPYTVILHVSYLDAVFETMSGFTTTGITVFSGLDSMPHSVLFWRAFTQWIGGLGIISMFLLIGFKGGGAANKLFMAEGHKIAAKRPKPGLFHNARVLWQIYIILTVAQILVLLFLGVGLFDALTHSFTTISTGGYSIYDNSIGQYHLAGFTHFNLIELTYIIFMIAGGLNFFIHYRILHGDVSALWDNSETRVFLYLLFGGIVLIFLGHIRTFGLVYSSEAGANHYGLTAALFHLKDITFQTVSVLTTTGYSTRDINTPYFTAIAKQIFLIYMVIGGCAGSTAGGVKVIRIIVLSKLVRLQIIKINTTRFARLPVTVDGEIVGENEVRRAFIIFFIWLLLLVFGGGITAFFTDLSGWASFSGMFSALGNIGPCYFSVEKMEHLPAVVKMTYILGMLAGRLEILPVLVIFNKNFYK